MDARLRGLQGSSTLLPTPRHSLETIADARYRLHLGDSIPTITGFFAERNARGTISFPNQLLIQKRNTYDTILNGAVSPVLHAGNVTLTFMPGLQFTIRRDSISPTQMNQNLFRQFVYLSTSSIANMLSISGDVIREALARFLRQSELHRWASLGQNGVDYRLRSARRPVPPYHS
jgi:hypothetical protein